MYIDFSGQLSTGINVAQWKIYTPKYNGKIVGGLSSKRYNKATRYFHGVFKIQSEVS